MEQISLEDKVSNTLKWLANQIACIQVYHWDEDYKKESPDIDPSTICQFTGLKDCEGNEIWEGDILEGESKSEIVYAKGTFAISFIGYNKRVFSYPLCYYVKENETVDGKIVGNKFDKKK